jgi:melanoma-associated antigen
VEDDHDSDELRPRHGQIADDTDDDAQDEPGGMYEDTESAQSADAQLAKKLVRYAISCEYSRTIIRRDGIKEKGKLVVALHARSFTDLR